ncbi:MAG: exonuclease domain-containing protein [Alphaproteobacteria bacterium]|nr:exonuclease domain-containing protein [Alphaproteobacteria bacterium]
MRLALITVFDLEFTAWECSMARHWLSPGEFKEVVQIGAVKLDADSFAPIAEFDLLVRPRVNFPLGPYFEKLTGITSSLVARQGMDFAAAFALFLEFAEGGPIASFGRDDRVLDENIRLYGMTGALDLPVFYDLRGWFAVQGVDPRGMHSCDIGPAVGIPFEGRTHNALDDARSIAGAMAKMAKRGARLRPAA